MSSENGEFLDGIVAKISGTCMGNGAERVSFSQESVFSLPHGLTPMHLDLILAELTDNCAEQGAKEIKVIMNTDRIRVEDDVVHEDAWRLVEKLNSIKISEQKEDEEIWPRKIYDKGRGVGIAEIVLGILDMTGGRLTYSLIDGNKITAEVSWDKAS